MRLTGRAGGFALGLMTMQSKEEEGKPGNNYTVVRVRRDLFAAPTLARSYCRANQPAAAAISTA